MTDDLIGRAEAQTAIQFAARRYTVAHEAHGEGQVVWSDNLISVIDAMNVLRDLPSAQPEIIRCKDCVYQTESWSGIKYCEAHGDHIGKDYDYCSNARRKENGH